MTLSVPGYVIQSLSLCVWVCVCAHNVCSSVFNLLFLSLLLYGFTLDRLCSVTKEGNGSSQLVSHSLSPLLTFCLASFFFFFSPPPSSSSLFLFCLGRRPQLARYPHRAMPEGAPRSWRIVRCSNGSVGVT